MSSAYDYRSAGTPAPFLAAASHREAQQVLDRYGEAALAAFAARLDALTPSSASARRSWRDDEDAGWPARVALVGGLGVARLACTQAARSAGR